MLFQLGVLYGNKNKFEKVREYLLKATVLKENFEVYRYLGITYEMEGGNVKALEFFENELLQQNVAIAKQRLTM